jgi:hypothetical protein
MGLTARTDFYGVIYLNREMIMDWIKIFVKNNQGVFVAGLLFSHYSSKRS